MRAGVGAVCRTTDAVAVVVVWVGVVVVLGARGQHPMPRRAAVAWELTQASLCQGRAVEHMQKL